MKYDYDLIVIGLGPAGMAVSIMGAEMGLSVCAIEKNNIGGECMNVGCIPSKALLRMGKVRHLTTRMADYELSETPEPDVLKPFEQIAEQLNFISEKKTIGMFDRVDLIYRQGAARMVDAHTVEVGERRVTAKRIYICIGTSPAIPKFPGLDQIEVLTNENMFHLEEIPESMIVLGGGAIACEMAQAFSRLGSKVTMIIRGPRLMWREDQDTTDLLEATFEREGITILREQKPTQFTEKDARVVMETDAGQTVEAERVLVAAGRQFNFESLELENAGIKYSEKGIHVNKRLQTSRKNIYACGDCNGYYQFSHAAMHQGMIALINSMSPWPVKFNFLKYVVPWTVFTEPQISRAGMSERMLQEKKIRYETVRVNYGDYGAAIAERIDEGHIKAFVSPTLGRILGVTIVGEGSGEMINEWALAIQNKLSMRHILFQQHSFPTMGFLTKRMGEQWMMGKMKSNFLKKMCAMMFRI